MKFRFKRFAIFCLASLRGVDQVSVEPPESEPGLVQDGTGIRMDKVRQIIPAGTRIDPLGMKLDPDWVV